MSGECKSYRLNEPMAWKEFKTMPDDIKITYIRMLQMKYNVPFIHIGKMMGCSQKTISDEIVRLGISEGKAVKGRSKKWDKEGFWAWANGVDKLPTPVPEEIPVEEPIQAEPEAFVEDDLPFDIVPVEEPDPVFPKPSELHYALCAEIDELRKRNDVLLKSNEELIKQHNCDSQALEKWRITCVEYEEKVKILEAQMEVVRMIFGGKNNGN